MPIRSLLVNVTDVARSVDFYVTHLDAVPLGEVTSERALLDVVTATVELVRTPPDAPASTWVGDDLQRGFRHVGFKVDAVDPRAERLRAAGVPFHLEPLEAEGGVRITFFRDPDGTLLEMVERDLQYTTVLDEAGVAAERALGAPSRPRFDHVGATVADLAATQAAYAPLGFTTIGHIAQPADPRGFDIHYLKSGDSVVEVFTYRVDEVAREPQPTAPGFAAAVLDVPPGAGTEALRPVGERAGHRLHADADGLVLALEG